MPTVGLEPLTPVWLLHAIGRRPELALPEDKVGADATHVPNVAVVLAGENEWVGVRTPITGDDTNFALVDKPIGKGEMSLTVKTVSKMAIRVDKDLVLEVAAAADDSGVRLNVEGGGGVVVGETPDWLWTCTGFLVVLDNDKGVMRDIAFERDVFIIVVVGYRIKSGHGQVESLGCYKNLAVRVVRVWKATEKGKNELELAKCKRQMRNRPGKGANLSKPVDFRQVDSNTTGPTVRASSPLVRPLELACASPSLPICLSPTCRWTTEVEVRQGETP
jgi:hypothetical protein